MYYLWFIRIIWRVSREASVGEESQCVNEGDRDESQPDPLRARQQKHWS